MSPLSKLIKEPHQQPIVFLYNDSRCPNWIAGNQIGLLSLI